MIKSRIRRIVPLAIPILAIAIFCLDCLTPVGVVDWVLYFIPLLLSFYGSGRFLPYWLAAIFSVLTVMGFYLSPAGIERIETGVALTNLWMGIGTLWVVAVVVSKLRQAADETCKLSRAVEQSPISICVTDISGRISYVNPKFAEVTGYTLNEVEGEKVCTVMFGEMPPEQHKGLLEIINAGKEWRGTSEDRKKNGERYLASSSITPVFNEAGKIINFLVVSEDITERKRSEQALLQSEAQFRAAFEQAAVGMAQSDLDGRWLRVNSRICNILGYSREELVLKSFRDLTHPDDLEGSCRLMRQLLTGELETYTLEKRYFRKDRSTVAVNVTLSLMHDATGKPKYFIGVIEDVTANKRAAEAMRESERNFRNIFESSHDAILTADPSSRRFTSANLAALKMFGAKSQADFVAHAILDLSPGHQPDGRLSEDKSREVIETAMREGSHCFEWVHQRINGETFLADVLLTLVKLNGRNQILATVRDITERKRGEMALRESEERFREIAESIEEVFWVADPVRSRILYVSPAYEKIWGQSCQHLYDEPNSWIATIHPEDRGRVQLAIEKQETPGAYNEDYRILRPDGEIRWINDKAFPVRGITGKVQRVVGVAHDITERRQLEDQFRQSQKMEAIGQLAGGVAHDFNNILCAMILRSELAQTKENLPEETRDSLVEIRTYAERAANLTRQLLLFSRRQVMQPRDLDLNDVVTNIAKMLQRMIGEDVRLQLHLNPAPLMTRSDAGMLDQVLMNLAVNSRDAMPNGGRLLIETAEAIVDENATGLNHDLAPGHYIRLKVSDTGCGIPPEILPKIFEPFFTTKEEGKGTGLGLATVFGIVKQHRGTVKVDSVPGKGTTFDILLPGCDVTPIQTIKTTARPKPPGGSETILVAEDDPSMRTLICLMLKKYGYNVLEAAHGKDAQNIWQEQRGAVALLVTDLVMPQTGGLELARHLRADQPHLKVLFMSGYSTDIAGQEFQLRNGENFLQKPFATDKFLTTIRRCLDE